jgi:hypothetical protein
MSLATVGGVIVLAGPALARDTSAAAPARTSSSLNVAAHPATASSSAYDRKHHDHHGPGYIGTPGTGCYAPGAYRSRRTYGTSGTYGPYGVHETHGTYQECGPNFRPHDHDGPHREFDGARPGPDGGTHGLVSTLVGPQGVQGLVGPQGVQGLVGPQGVQGLVPRLGAYPPRSPAKTGLTGPRGPITVR